MNALNILKINRTSSEALGDDKSIIAIYDEAIKELEDIQSNINTSIEEKESKNDKRRSQIRIFYSIRKWNN